MIKIKNMCECDITQNRQTSPRHKMSHFLRLIPPLEPDVLYGRPKRTSALI